MKRYAVSLVFTKDSYSKMNIYNALRIVTASSKEEAFGIAFKDVKDNVKEVEEHRFAIGNNCRNLISPNH